MGMFKQIFGYLAATGVLVVLILGPFVLMPCFSRLVGELGIRPHPRYAGGPVVRTLQRGGYQIELSAPAGAMGPLERTRPFVQVAWSPAEAVPEVVDERLDLHGDGRPEVRLSFRVPRDPRTPLQGRVEVLDATRVEPLAELGRSADLSAMLVRVDHRIVARIPVK